MKPPLSNKIIKKIQAGNYDYMSFDVFDTLIFRTVNSPSDVFDIVEKLYNEKNKRKIKNFRENRISAAKIAYNKHYKIENTLDEIYNELGAFYNKNICNKLKKYEIEAEFNVCVPNPEMVEVFDFCLKNNIKIIIVSDMYLSYDTLKKLLTKCGITGYEKLYVSSEYKGTKFYGNLFDLVFKDLKTSKILHIGDNIVSDFVMPTLHGLRGYRYKCTGHRFSFLRGGLASLKIPATINY